MEQRGAFRWHVEAQAEEIVAQLQPVYERPCVQVIHGPEARDGHPSASYRALRSTGSSAADRMFPRISSSGLRRVPSVPGSTAATLSTSSAPMVSATCACFGP